jgi:2-methylcitrate dehydratase PrpD
MQLATATLSQRLADYVCSLQFEDIAPQAIEKVKDHLINHLGLAYAGRSTADGKQAVDIARRLAHGVGDTTIIGEAFKAPALDSAFANCTLMRADNGQDDVLFPAGVHAGLVTLPVALALGEQQHSSGKDVLTAIVVGYDAIGKLGNVTWAWEAGAPRRPTIPFGPFGSVAVAAHLLRLSQEQTTHAIGYAAHSAMGLAEGGLTTHYYSLVARNGIMGALLAGAGGQTALTVLEGKFGFYRSFFGQVPANLEDSLNTFGKYFEIMNATTKRYPGTALNIVPVQLAIAMRREYALAVDDITNFRVYLPRERRNFSEGHAPPPFTSRTSAASSALFNLAIVLLDGTIDSSRYAQFDSPEILDIARRGEAILEEGHPIRYARLEIMTRSGERYVRESDNHVFPREGWLEWLTRHADGQLPRDRLARLEQLVANLEAVDDVSELLACVSGSG